MLHKNIVCFLREACMMQHHDVHAALSKHHLLIIDWSKSEDRNVTLYTGYIVHKI